MRHLHKHRPGLLSTQFALAGMWGVAILRLQPYTIMLEFFWDLHQQKAIVEAKTDASQAKEEVRSQNDRNRELEFTVHRMALASQAMWELLRSRFDLAEEELLAKIKEIDLRDGRLDGRMQAQSSKCSNCGRVMNAKNPRCIYFGSPGKRPYVFQ